MSEINLLPGAINQLIADVTDTHKVTQADRYGIMAAILDEYTSQEEIRSLDRLIRLIVKGRVEVTDEF